MTNAEEPLFVDVGALKWLSTPGLICPFSQYKRIRAGAYSAGWQRFSLLDIWIECIWHRHCASSDIIRIKQFSDNSGRASIIGEFYLECAVIPKDPIISAFAYGTASLYISDEKAWAPKLDGQKWSFQFNEGALGYIRRLSGSISGPLSEIQSPDDKGDTEDGGPKLPHGPIGAFLLCVGRLPFLAKLGVFAGLGGLAGCLVNADSWWRERGRYGLALCWALGAACYGSAIWLAVSMPD
jgi:hypothetical protein